MEKFIMFIVWKLPPKFLLWAVVRGFADATTGKWGNTDVNAVRYKDIYDRIIAKYKIA